MLRRKGVGLVYARAAVGGAMDLAAGARSVRVITSHTTRSGAPKLLGALTLPATGRGIVNRIYTELAILEPTGGAFRVLRTAPGVSLGMLAARSGAPLVMAADAQSNA